MPKNKLSVCLATHNEEKNLDRCLKSVVNIADEIVIADGNSLDMTREIAKKFKAKILQTSNKLMFHLNKQMAIDNASGDWILLLDADEEITQDLKKEVVHAIHNSSLDISGYWIPRKNIIFKKWIKHTGWWPDYQLRLYRKGVVKYPCRSVHEHPQINGKTEKLTQPLIHYNYQSISQYLKRLDLYSENDKNVWLKENKPFYWLQAINLPADEFIKRFIVWEGYKDGLHGLLLSMLQALSQVVVFAKVWQEKHFPDNSVSKEKIGQALKQKLKEYQWWNYQSKINQGCNKLKTIIFKFKQKISI